MPYRRLYRSERFLRIIFGVSLFIVLCMGGLAYKYISTLSKSFKMVEHTYEVRQELQNILYLLRDSENGQRGYLISQDSTFLESYTSGRPRLQKKIDQLKSLTFDDKVQQENIRQLEEKIDDRLSVLDKAFNLGNNKDIDEFGDFLVVLNQGREAMNSIRFKIYEMIDHENDLLKARKKSSSESLSNAPLVVYYVLIIALGMLLLIYAKMSKNLRVLGKNNEELQMFKESTAQSEMVSKHCTWIYHIDADYYEYSDNLFVMLGEEPQSFEPSFDKFLSFVHPDDYERVKQNIEQMVDDDEDLPFLNYRVVKKDGEIRYFKGFAKKIVNGEDRILLGTIADITDEVESYQLVEERNLELERNNKELESFNYVASHDLQEPLRKIQTFISRLEDKDYDKLSDNGKTYVKRIKIASGRMRNLIDDLLQFSRTHRSEELLEVSKMNSLLNAAQQDLNDIIFAKNAKITSDSMPEMKVIPFQIKQLFQNLISNSLKYSKEDVTPVIKIKYTKTKKSDLPEIKSQKFSEYHTITITDNGIGFDQIYADKIFILFNRLHSKNEFTGTGIGLSICKKIVENHEGHISACGVLGKGATITVHLPYL